MFLREVGVKAVLAYRGSRAHLEGAYPALIFYRASAGDRSDGLADFDLGETPVAEA